MDNIATRADPARFLDLIGGDPENRPAIYGSGGEDSFFASLFAENFRHTDTIKHGFWLSANRSLEKKGRAKSEGGEAESPFCYAARHGKQACGRDCGSREFRDGAGCGVTAS